MVAELNPLQQNYNTQTATAQKIETDLRQAENDLQRASGDLMTLVQKQMEVSNRISLEESSAQRENEDLIAAEKSSQAQAAGLTQHEAQLKEITTRLEQAQTTANQAKEAIAQGKRLFKNYNRNVRLSTSNFPLLNPPRPR